MKVLGLSYEAEVLGLGTQDQVPGRLGLGLVLELSRSRTCKNTS